MGRSGKIVAASGQSVTLQAVPDAEVDIGCGLTSEKTMTRLLRNVSAFLIGLILIMAYGLSFADDKKKGVKIDQTINSNNSYEIDKSVNQSQEQTQIQDQTQANEQNVSFASRRNAAGNDAPSVYASGICTGSKSGGLSLPGGNASFGGTFTDDECNMRETARMLYEFGERVMAIELLCLTPSAAVLGSCKPMQDYNREMVNLKTQNQMMLEDATRMEEEANELRKEMGELEERLKERDARIHEAGQLKQ